MEDPAYQAALKARLLKGSSPQLEVLLHYYAYGKPKMEISLEDKTMTVIIDRCSQCEHQQKSKDPRVIEHQPPNTQESSICALKQVGSDQEGL